MSTIFINYRRSDTGGHAGRLARDLREHYGSGNVLMDIVTIEGGDDFEKVIADNITRSHVVLALIGPTWLSAQDEHGNQRLDDETDQLRLEIEMAFEQNIPVIPILVEGARMPTKEELPGSIRDLRRRHWLTLSNVSWDEDVKRILEGSDRQSDRNRQSRIENRVTQVQENLEEGFNAARRHPVFLDEVERVCTDLWVTSEDWAQGRVDVSTEGYNEGRYNEVLLRLYKQASHSVFSTSIPGYFETWLNPLGREIVEAHKASKAQSIERVFIFDSDSEVTRQHVDVMQDQQDTRRIEVRVLSGRDVIWPTFLIDRDFTIIDEGDVIARTAGRAPRLSAIFHFYDARIQAQARELKERLHRESESLAKFRERWDRLLGAD